MLPSTASRMFRSPSASLVGSRFVRAMTLAACCMLCVVSSIDCQVPQPTAQPPDPTMNAQPGTPALASPDQLDDLLGPIALYPDPLVAIILSASTAPFDIVLANRYIQGHGDTTAIDEKPWDPSVKALAHYPTVLKWMDDNIEWTQSVGEAFRDQQQDVMNSIQQLRARARAAGNLSTTPQQKVEMENDDIRIVPAEQDIIYVPEYDPEIIYYERPPGYFGPMMYFGNGWIVGGWMDYDCDWSYHRVWMGDWRPGWTYRPGWGVPWYPNPHRHDYPLGPRWHEQNLPHPHPMPNAPGSHGEIPHAPRPGATGNSGRPDNSGWGKNIAQPAPAKQPNRPQQQSQPRAPFAPAPEKPQTVFGGYGRGSDARDNSNRGAVSRQADVPQAPRVEPPQQVQRAPQQIQRPAPAPERPMFTPRAAPAPSVFGGGNGGAARMNSARGAQSRSNKR